MTLTPPALLALSLLAPCGAFELPAAPPAPRACVRSRARAPLACDGKQPSDPEAVTEKYGLEAGLFTALKQKLSGGGGGGEGGGQVAKAGDLLKRYGGAYLLTSTSLALVSFSLCYARTPIRTRMI